MMVGNNVPMFKNCQPCVVTNAPELNELTAIVPNTQKLMAASALFFSSGLKADIAKTVDPLNRKFKATPSKNKAVIK